VLFQPLKREFPEGDPCRRDNACSVNFGNAPGELHPGLLLRAVEHLVGPFALPGKGIARPLDHQHPGVGRGVGLDVARQLECLLSFYLFKLPLCHPEYFPLQMHAARPFERVMVDHRLRQAAASDALSGIVASVAFSSY